MQVPASRSARSAPSSASLRFRRPCANPDVPKRIAAGNDPRDVARRNTVRLPNFRKADFRFEMAGPLVAAPVPRSAQGERVCGRRV